MKSSGFTLYELLITLALFLVLALIGVCSYQHVLQKNEEQVIIEELRTIIQYSKIQALVQGHPVVLVPMDTSNNWIKGINLKSYPKNNMLHQWQGHHPLWRLHWRGVNTENKIIFAHDPIQAMSNGRFFLINIKTEEQIEIILNRLGRIRIKEPLSQRR